MGLSPIHIAILAFVAVLMLGGGRFSSMMSDVAKGVKTFKKGLADDAETDSLAPPAARIEPSPKVGADRDEQSYVAGWPTGQ